MLMECIGSLFGVQSSESRNPKNVKDPSFSVGNSLNSNELCVRVVHAGGKVDLYRNPVAVSQLTKRYSGMAIARPEVFKNPYEAVLSSRALLLPGQKYYLVPIRQAEKETLCQEEKGSNGCSDESDDSVFSARDYYVSKEQWSRCKVKKHIRSNRPSVVKSRSWRGSDWEPSLTRSKELSP
ncbi:LOW QUALITY PROTEIN: hypothetical protein OSB04_018516 [Centaurea solstitialis]|uniref:Uncharacterized protein n=1 Tax=Centaurea solstitialis TaxID=347529 RepID=A0AA38TFX6_9ASTR|nr:LOW QUALITY PROTEIN: hypothetical protein OSB04_018516 [Centaurea solstitialis]